jgi:hypothetical protein
LPDGATLSTIQAGFTIPPNYTPGTPLIIHVLWNATTTGNIVFAPNFLSVGRAGSAHLEDVSATAGLTVVGGTLLAAPATVYSSKETLLQIVSPATGVNLAPGDAINFGMFRNSNDSTDTLGGFMVIQGLWVTYQ